MSGVLSTGFTASRLSTSVDAPRSGSGNSRGGSGNLRSSAASSRRHCRGPLGIRGPILPTALLLLASLSSGGFESPPGQDPTSLDSDDRVRCPDCDKDGQQICPRCDGKKKLERPCRRCEGTGERECPQCAKYDAGEGLIECGYCGGSGSLGRRDEKTCPECGGAGTRTCPTCRGDGHLDCPETEYGGICPTCRFVGKISCKTCSGTTEITRHKLRELQRTKRTGEEDPSTAARENGARVDAESSSSTSAPAASTGTAARLQTEELEKRLRRLAKLQGQLGELGAANLRRRSDEHLRRSKELLGELNEVGITESAFRETLADIQARSRSLRGRLQEAYEGVDELQRFYARCEKRWASRPSSSSSYRRAYRSWQEDMDLSLSLAEAHAAEIEQRSPLALAELATSLDEALRKVSEGATATIAEVRRAEEERRLLEETAAREAARLAAQEAQDDTLDDPSSGKTDSPDISAGDSDSDSGERVSTPRKESGGSLWGAAAVVAALGAAALGVVWFLRGRATAETFEDL